MFRDIDTREVTAWLFELKDVTVQTYSVEGADSEAVAREVLAQHLKLEQEQGLAMSKTPEGITTTLVAQTSTLSQRCLSGD